MTLVPPVIEHHRDVVRDEAGDVDQLYSYLIYRFGEPSPILARAYLDESDKVAVMSPGPVPGAVLDYLKQRFWQIDQLGADGYHRLWSE